MKNLILMALLIVLNHTLLAQMRGRVQVQDGTIVTDQGTLLRGAFVGLNLNPSIPSKAQLDLIKSYGLNTVHLYAGCVQAVQEGLADGPEYVVEYTDQIIDWAEELGLYVVMTIGGCSQPFAYDADYVRDFWTFFAPRYKDKTHVVYEIMNEPFHWHAPYDDATIQMNRDSYDLIRSLAPDTHVQFFSYSGAM